MDSRDWSKSNLIGIAEGRLVASLFQPSGAAAADPAMHERVGLLMVQSSLFRPEALRNQSERLHGNVHLALPMSWQLIGYLLLAGLVIAVLFLATSQYARTEVATGEVVLDRGVARVTPSRPGVFEQVAVHEDQRVEMGDILLKVRSEEDLAAGGTAPERARRSIAVQDGHLKGQISSLRHAFSAERAQIGEEMAGARAELTSLAEQISDQQKLVESAREDVVRVAAIAKKGFISKRDLASREDTLVQRRQQLAQLEQLHAAKRATLESAQRSIVQSLQNSQAQTLALEAQRGALAQQAAEAERSEGYVMRAQVAGRVTAVTARAGQPAAPGTTAMTIIPNGASSQARLYVTSSSIGFIRRGQEVRLALDAYPYQRFGTVRARITDVSDTVISQEVNGSAQNVFLVTAQFVGDGIHAFGRLQPLLPGMTLSGRIVTQQRSLFGWIFEPILAVAKR